MKASSQGNHKGQPYKKLLSGAMQYYFPFLDIGSQFKLRTPIYPCKKISREQNIEALEKKKK